MNIQTRTLIATLTCLVIGPALADTPIYKWVDAQGQVHYSTVPHSDKAQQLAIQNTSTPNAGTSVTPAPGSATADTVGDAKLTQPQASDSAACQAAREELAKYLHADKLYSADAKGNKIELSGADKQKALNAARAYVSQACNGGGT